MGLVAGNDHLQRRSGRRQSTTVAAISENDYPISGRRIKLRQRIYRLITIGSFGEDVSSQRFPTQLVPKLYPGLLQDIAKRDAFVFVVLTVVILCLNRLARELIKIGAG